MMSPGIKRAMVVLLVLMVGLGVYGAATGSGDDPPTRRSSGPPTSDASAELACVHWSNIRGDIDAGILTDGEIRAKLQEVHGRAKSSAVPGVASSAQRLLAAVTQRADDSELLAAAGALTTACRGVG